MMNTPRETLQSILDDERAANSFEPLYAAQAWYRDLEPAAKADVADAVNAALEGQSSTLRPQDALLLSGYLDIPGAADRLVRMLRTRRAANTTEGYALYFALHEATLSEPQRIETCACCEAIMQGAHPQAERLLALGELAFRDFDRARPHLQRLLDDATRPPDCIGGILRDRLDQVGYPQLMYDLASLIQQNRRRERTVKDLVRRYFELADRYEWRQTDHVLSYPFAEHYLGS